MKNEETPLGRKIDFVVLFEKQKSEKRQTSQDKRAMNLKHPKKVNFVQGWSLYFNR